MPSENRWQRESAIESAVFGQVGPLQGVLHFGRPEDEYTALTASAGLVDLSDWTQIELTGSDRIAFLHNMCTNEIRKLAPGAGCEAFFLNAKGHTIAHLLIFAGESSHCLFGAPGQNEFLLAHLHRYLIRENVQLLDQTNKHGQFLIAGPEAATVLHRLTGQQPAWQPLAGSEVEIAGRLASARRVQITGAGDLLLRFPIEERLALWDAVADCGARPCGLEALETARVEFGFPIFGRDITDKNLPQEVGRIEQSINFVKGCYIGQETVARIDALGHVNQSLVAVKFDTEQPGEPGARLSAGGQGVGEVTSCVFSPRLARALALAYVRRTHATIGSKLDSSCGSAEVIALPVR